MIVWTVIPSSLTSAVKVPDVAADPKLANPASIKTVWELEIVVASVVVPDVVLMAKTSA